MTESALPSPATGQEVVATYPDYEAAQAAVDLLSDRGFPIEHVQIVGRGVTSVERVLGRMTTGRAALGGLMSGAWFGVLLGLLLLLFTDRSWLAVLAVAIVSTSIWGAIFGAIGHSATKGQRDFTSVKSLVATSYDIMVDVEHAGQAASLLSLR